MLIHIPPKRKRRKSTARLAIVLAAIVVTLAGILLLRKSQPEEITLQSAKPLPEAHNPESIWLERFRGIDELFHHVYSAGWEGANGAIGDAHVFAVTHDSSLLRFHTTEHDMRRMFNGTWVDDRAWICLAECYWWEFTGRTNYLWINDAKQRYLDARAEGRLSNHEGFWSWYNWPPNARVNDRILTNSNMNQMVTVACWLYEATHEQRFLDDALLVWNGDKKTPGIEKTFYRGDGKWEGKPGLAAFGKQLPWEGVEYCSVMKKLYEVTKEEKYKSMIVATAKRILDPTTGWLDPIDFYQVHMDGNGAFVHYLLDAYLVAPDALSDIPEKVGKMLDHVWTNAHGRATVTLHRESDNGIRNGWNPNGGEDGYNVNEIGLVHPQSQAVRAFGVFVYVMKKQAEASASR